MGFRCTAHKAAGELVFVSRSKAKNCFRNFLNALLLNTGRQRPYTPAVFASKNPRILFMAKRQNSSMQLCNRFRSRPSDFL